MTQPVSFIPSQNTRVEFLDDKYFITSIGYNLAIAPIANPTHYEFLEGHSQVISEFTVSRSRKIVASGQAGKENPTERSTPVIVWDINSRQQKLVLRGHTGAIKSLSITEDDRLLAVSTTDSTKIWIWDLQEQDVGTFINLRNIPSTIVFSGHYQNEWYLHVTVDRTVYQYAIKFDHRTFEFSEKHQAYTNPTNGYFRTYSASGGEYPDYYGGSDSGEISIYNGMSKTLRTFLQVDPFNITAIVPIGENQVLVGGKCLSLLKGDDTNWSIVRKVEMNCAIRTISYLNGRALVRTEDSCVWMVDIPRLTVSKIIDGLRGPALQVAATDEYAAAAVGSAGFILFKIESDVLDFVSYLPGTKAHSVAALPNGEFVAGCEDGSLHCVDETGTVVWKSDRVHRGPVTAICVTKDFIATGGCDGFIRLVTHQSRTVVNESLVHTGTVLQIIPAINFPQRVHSVAEDRTFVTTEVTTGKRICKQIISCRTGFESIQQFTDGELEVLVAMGDGSLRAYDWPREGVIFEEHTPDGLQINSIALKPKTRVVACGGQSEYISIIDFNTGSWTVCGAAHTMITHSLCWTPNGRVLLSAADDGLCMWRF